MKPQKDLYQSFLEYSFLLLAGKAYSEAEMLFRLKRRAKKVRLSAGLGDTPESVFEGIIARIIARLRELNYLNDDKILENYFEYRLKSRPQGKYSFLQKMRKRGISIDKARAEWEKREVDEESLARDLLSSKKRLLNSSKMTPILRRRKIAALLAARGFASDTIWEVLDSIR